MRKFTLFFAFLFFIGLNFAYAQTRTINGTVTSADNGQPLPGVTVQVKGTTVGTITDLNGKYSINVNLNQGKTLVFSFVGMATQEIAIGQSNTINVVMKSSALAINEVVVTALGITRQKKALGYATQQVSGAAISQVKSDNVLNALSGRVAGVDVKTSGNMGGSTNVIIRGSSSLGSSNQALFVVDGVPMENNTTNTGVQAEGGGGYDWGSVASDIDPSNIKSVSVLKGAAATALYGSRAANGVIMITTKTGNDDKYLGKHGIGISLSSNVTFGTVDRSTFPKYQHQYGAGYYPYYSDPYSTHTPPGPGQNPFLYHEMVNGQMGWVVPTTEDASLGAKFDPNLMVWQWDSFVPQSPNYGKPYAWQAAKNGPITFFNTAVTNSNTIAVNGASKAGAYRFAYTRFNQTGILPDSKLTKNTFSLNASHNITKNLTISTVANYTHQYAMGRNGTGYSNNMMTSFRQWWEVNVDVKELKAMYDATGKNVTWNMKDPVNGDFTPEYWNNYYWERANNTENDTRDHLFGNVKAKWNITDNLNVVGMATLETYSTFMQWFLAQGTVPAGVGPNLTTASSGYARRNLTSTESNYKLMIDYMKNITEKLNLKAMVGGNIRRDNYSSIFVSTNGGLVVPGLYALANSASTPLAPSEALQKRGINSLFGEVSLGYNNLLYLDATLRGDRSSTLPVSNDTYLYPSVSGSFIFSNLLHASWLPFAKLRLNYAEVGNDAGFAQLYNTYSMSTPFNGSPTAYLPYRELNSQLKPEISKSYEVGLTANFIHNRVGFDVDYYHRNTINQVMPVAITSATGYGYKYFNAGTIANHGVELTVHGTPIQNKNFSWDITVNWSMNRNKVVSLYSGSKNLLLGGLFGVTVNARVGQPYGVLEGSDYVYYKNTHERVVDSTGGYAGTYQSTSSTDHVLGQVAPDWKAGISNTFRYKNVSLSFLIDISKGGHVYSLDQAFGQSTGIYATSVGNNAKGNPKRDFVANGGGFLLNGVYPGGTKNTTYVEGNNTFFLGFNANPAAAFVYDASYVKLREAELDYTFPHKLVERLGIKNLSLGFVGSNLWIIFKNLPYADPEAGTGAGNIQGIQSGVMPTTRNFGFNLKVQF
jgi:TonB-linked SusC/RagA family outer membrane protein